MEAIFSKNTNTAFSNIPDLIIYICLAFYYEFAEWDTKYKSKYMEIINTIITNKHIDYQTACFSTICCGKYSYHWKFMIEKTVDNPHTDPWNNSFGIWKINKQITNIDESIDTCFLEHGSGYAFISSIARLTDTSKAGWPCINGQTDEEITKYAQPCAEGDIIEMHLELKQLTLSYKINGQDYGIAFKDIEQTEYKAAIWVGGEASAIKLLD